MSYVSFLSFWQRSGHSFASPVVFFLWNVQLWLTGLHPTGNMDNEKWNGLESMLEEMRRHPAPKSQKPKADKTWARMMGV